MDEKKLLVVVDMQRDFVDSGVLGSKRASDIVNGIVKKVSDAEMVLFTLDTHEDDYMNTQEGINLPVAHCIRGTDGRRLVSELEAYQKKACAIEKNTFGSVQLGLFVAEQFEQRNIDCVELVGVCTGVCVLSNALLIKAFCPEVRIVVDAACCACVTRQSHINALNAMKMCQIEILNMDADCEATDESDAV